MQHNKVLKEIYEYFIIYHSTFYENKNTIIPRKWRISDAPPRPYLVHFRAFYLCNIWLNNRLESSPPPPLALATSPLWEFLESPLQCVYIFQSWFNLSIFRLTKKADVLRASWKSASRSTLNLMCTTLLCPSAKNLFYTNPNYISSIPLQIQTFLVQR